MVKNNWQIKLLYDGECPLCLREVNFLQNRDRGRGLIAFVDISDRNYSPAENCDIDFTTAMGTIHAILPDGTIINNLEVFRRVYTILGMGWLYSFTKLPIIGAIAEAIYQIWAKWRLKLTGRPSLEQIIAEREKTLNCRDSEGCRVN
jgi:predicted DCC family thiol-disulfide oxidoreductase YuxK